MDATQVKELDVVEDEDIVVPEGHVFETIPPGTYNAKLVGFKTVDKPSWKLKGEPDEDRLQYAWTFLITDGDYEGTRLSDYTNRTWHEKAKAHKHAAALLGVPSLTPGGNKSTRELAGKTCQLWVTEVESKKEPGTFRNYIDRVTVTPSPRQRPARPTQAPQAPQGTERQIKGFPKPDGSSDAEWTIDE